MSDMFDETHGSICQKLGSYDMLCLTTDLDLLDCLYTRRPPIITHKVGYGE